MLFRAAADGRLLIRWIDNKVIESIDLFTDPYQSVLYSVWKLETILQMRKTNFGDTRTIHKSRRFEIRTSEKLWYGNNFRG